MQDASVTSLARDPVPVSPPRLEPCTPTAQVGKKPPPETGAMDLTLGISGAENNAIRRNVDVTSLPNADTSPRHTETAKDNT